MLTIPLAHGRELEVTRVRTQPGEVFRLAMYHRRGSFRHPAGEFCCTRAELRLLGLALDAATFPEAA